MKKKLLIIMLILMIAVTGCFDGKNKESANTVGQVQINEASNESSNDDSNEEEISNEQNEQSKNNDDNNNDKNIVSHDNNADANILNLENQTNIEVNDDSETNKNTNIERPSVNDNTANNSSKFNNNSDSGSASVNITDNEDNETEVSEEKGTYILKVTGNVSNELSLSLSDLKAMNNYIFEGDFFSLNSFGTKGYTHFKGVNLWKILDEKAQMSSTASKVKIVAHDGYKVEFTIEQVKKQDYIDEQNAEMKYPIIIAWEENKEEYDGKEEAPFKLVVGQKEANDVNKPQWVSNIDKIVIE